MLYPYGNSGYQWVKGISCKSDKYCTCVSRVVRRRRAGQTVLPSQAPSNHCWNVPTRWLPCSAAVQLCRRIHGRRPPSVQSRSSQSEHSPLHNTQHSSMQQIFTQSSRQATKIKFPTFSLTFEMVQVAFITLAVGSTYHTSTPCHHLSKHVSVLLDIFSTYKYVTVAVFLFARWVYCQLQMQTASDHKHSLSNSKIHWHSSQNRIPWHSLIFQKVGTLLQLSHVSLCTLLN